LLLLSLNILPLIFNGEYNYTPDEEIIGSLADLEIDMLITECRIKYTWMGTKKLKIIGISEDKNVEITSYESFIVSPLKVENYLMEMLKSFSHIDHTIIEEKRDNMSVIIYEYTGADAKQIITKTSRRVQLIEIYK
jgi:hypothetical protein